MGIFITPQQENYLNIPIQKKQVLAKNFLDYSEDFLRTLSELPNCPLITEKKSVPPSSVIFKFLSWFSNNLEEIHNEEEVSTEFYDDYLGIMKFFKSEIISKEDLEFPQEDLATFFNFINEQENTEEYYTKFITIFNDSQILSSFLPFDSKYFLETLFGYFPSCMSRTFCTVIEENNTYNLKIIQDSKANNLEILKFEKSLNLLIKNFSEVFCSVDIVAAPENYYSSSLQLFLTLKFEEITIKNKLEDSTNIPEIFVAIPLVLSIKEEECLIKLEENILGHVPTLYLSKVYYSDSKFMISIKNNDIDSLPESPLSFLEDEKIYSHSHLSKDASRDCFSVFCLGSGDFRSFLISFSKINFLSLEEEEIKLHIENFYLQLLNYISYESIEGTPYWYLTEIREVKKEFFKKQLEESHILSEPFYKISNIESYFLLKIGTEEFNYILNLFKKYKNNPTKFFYYFLKEMAESNKGYGIKSSVNKVYKSLYRLGFKYYIDTFFKVLYTEFEILKKELNKLKSSSYFYSNYRGNLRFFNTEENELVFNNINESLNLIYDFIKCINRFLYLKEKFPSRGLKPLLANSLEKLYGEYFKESLREKYLKICPSYNKIIYPFFKELLENYKKGYKYVEGDGKYQLLSIVEEQLENRDKASCFLNEFLEKIDEIFNREKVAIFSYEDTNFFCYFKGEEVKRKLINDLPEELEELVDTSSNAVPLEIDKIGDIKTFKRGSQNFKTIIENELSK